MSKYALMLDISNYNHVTIDVYTLSNDQLDGYIQTVNDDIQHVLLRFNQKAIVRNLKCSYPEFSPRIKHVAVDGQVLHSLRQVLDNPVYQLDDVRDRYTRTGLWNPHSTYSKSMPTRDEYMASRLYLKKIGGPLVHEFGNFQTILNDNYNDSKDSVCLNHNITIIAIPCGHESPCPCCYKNIQAVCPICSQEIKGFLSVYNTEAMSTLL